MSNNKQRPTAEAIENAEAFIQERFGGTSPDFAKIITVKNIKLSHLLAEYKALAQMEQQPVSIGERMSVEEFFEENTSGLTDEIVRTVAVDLMQRYAAKQCAIVAAEKDAVIRSANEKIMSFAGDVSNLELKLNRIEGHRDVLKNELAAKEAECQRLREAVIEARKLILKFHIPFSTGDEETYTEKVFKPFKELCQPQSQKEGEQKG